MDPSIFFRKDNFYLMLHTKDASALVPDLRRSQLPFKISDVYPNVPGNMFMAYKFLFPDQLPPQQPLCVDQVGVNCGRPRIDFWEVAVSKVIINNKFSNALDLIITVRYNRNRGSFTLVRRPGLFGIEDVLDEANRVRTEQRYQRICPVDPLIPIDYTITRGEEDDPVEVRVFRADLVLTFNERLATKLGMPRNDFRFARIDTGFRPPSMEPLDRQINISCPLIESTKNSGQGLGEKIMDTFIKPPIDLAEMEELLSTFEPTNPVYHRLAPDGDISRGIEIMFLREDGTVMTRSEARPSDNVIRLHFRRCQYLALVQ